MIPDTLHDLQSFDSRYNLGAPHEARCLDAINTLDAWTATKSGEFTDEFRRTLGHMPQCRAAVNLRFAPDLIAISPPGRVELVDVKYNTDPTRQTFSVCLDVMAHSLTEPRLYVFASDDPDPLDWPCAPSWAVMVHITKHFPRGTRRGSGKPFVIVSVSDMPTLGEFLQATDPLACHLAARSLTIHT